MRAFAALSACLLSSLSFAQAESGPTEDVKNSEELDLATLLNTVSSASKAPEDIRKAPATVTVFEAEDIRRSGATTVPELLRLVPGVQVFRTGPGSETVTIRGAGGLTSHEVIVLLDGMPLNNPVDGTMDWGALGIDLQDVHRVEVVRGPVSTIYGAGAYTGVISITTIWEGGGSVGTRARASAGGDSELHPEASVSGRVANSNKLLNWQITAQALYDTTMSNNPLGSSPPLRGVGLLGHLELILSPDSKLTFQVASSVDEHSAVDQLVLEADRQTNLSFYLAARYEVAHLPGILDTFSVWLRDSFRAVGQTGEPNEFSNSQVIAFKTAVGFDLSARPLSELVTTIGGNAGFSYVDTPYLDPSVAAQLRLDSGFYGLVRFEPSKPLTFTLRARGDFSEITHRLEFSYRASATYLSPYAAFRLSLGSAYRSPTWIEANARFIDPTTNLLLLEGNPNLLSARIESAEAAVIIDLTNALSVTPTVYVARMSNLIVPDFTPVVGKTFINDAVVHDVLGEEVEAHLKLSTSFSLFASLAILEGLAGNAPSDASGGFAQNSAVTAGLRVQGTLLSGRLVYGASGTYSSPRVYSFEAGVPSVMITGQVPNLVRLELGLSYPVIPSLPLRVYLKGHTFIPSGVIDSPFPIAGQLGSSAMLGLEYGH